MQTSSGATAAESVRPPEVVELALAMAFMVLSHAVPSAPPVRARLIDWLGQTGFFLAYGTLSVIVLLWVIVAFRRADPGLWLYAPPDGGRTLAVLVMPLATILVVGRLIQTPGEAASGVYRITTVPGSLGVLLWALLHLINLGSARQVILFGGMALIALIALVKNARRVRPGRRHVGTVPFLAVALGDEQLVLREIALPVLVGLVVYAGLLWLHPLVIGPDPLAGVW